MWILISMAQGTFFKLLSALLAAFEIEVEGKKGWAEDLPTFHRVTTLDAKIWARIISGSRSETGYHLFFFAFLLLVPLTAFVVMWWFPLYWITRVFACWFALFALWDYDWFVLNPFYTYRGLKKAKWHYNREVKWVFGLFPIDYLKGTIASIGLTLLAAAGRALRIWLDQRSWSVAWEAVKMVPCEHAIFLLTLATELVVLIRFSPRYHAWYRSMHDPAKDERHLAFPPREDSPPADSP